MGGALLMHWALKVGLLLVCAMAGEIALRRASAAARHLAWVMTMGACLVLPLTGGLLPAWRVLPRWKTEEKTKMEMPVALAIDPAPPGARILSGHLVYP